MLLGAAEFKTPAGAQKRCAFENTHCGGRWTYSIVRCLNGVRDEAEFNIGRYSEYTWRLERKARCNSKTS